MRIADTPPTRSTWAFGCLLPIKRLLADRNFNTDREHPYCGNSISGFLHDCPALSLAAPQLDFGRKFKNPDSPVFLDCLFFFWLVSRKGSWPNCPGCDALTFVYNIFTSIMASHLSHLMAIERPNSRVSLARSDTTCYHSFQDVDLHEPEVSCPRSQKPTSCPPPVSAAVTPPEEQRPGAREMRRQDSGYESMTAGRDSMSSFNQATSANSLSSSTRKRRTRPSAKRSPMSRSATTSPHPRQGRNSAISSPRSSRPSSPQHQQPVEYFHFPHFTSSDPALGEATPTSDLHTPSDPTATPTFAQEPQESSYPLPPQTTHYWTSDRTRRAEYAAIDAASKGVRGWVFRHVVPDCFIPQSKRRVGFEDDRGSVVRYRLDLDGDGKEECVRNKGWKGWLVRRR